MACMTNQTQITIKTSETVLFELFSFTAEIKKIKVSSVVKMNSIEI